MDPQAKVIVLSVGYEGPERIHTCLDTPENRSALLEMLRSEWTSYVSSAVLKPLDKFDKYVVERFEQEGYIIMGPYTVEIVPLTDVVTEKFEGKKWLS